MLGEAKRSQRSQGIPGLFLKVAHSLKRVVVKLWKGFKSTSVTSNNDLPSSSSIVKTPLSLPIAAHDTTASHPLGIISKSETVLTDTHIPRTESNEIQNGPIMVDLSPPALKNSPISNISTCTIDSQTIAPFLNGNSRLGTHSTISECPAPLPTENGETSEEPAESRNSALIETQRSTIEIRYGVRRAIFLETGKGQRHVISIHRANFKKPSYFGGQIGSHSKFPISMSEITTLFPNYNKKSTNYWTHGRTLCVIITIGQSSKM